MNAEEKYLLDLWGYVIIENALETAELTELNALIDAQDYTDPVDDNIHSQAEIVGPKFPLDYVYKN